MYASKELYSYLHGAFNLPCFYPGFPVMAGTDNRPDFEISNFWIWPKNPKVGENFDIRMRVYNYGKKKANISTTVSLYVGGATVPYTFNLAPIPPGKEWTHYHTVLRNKKGKYTVRVIADNAKKIPECRKDNNTRSMSFRVK